MADDKASRTEPATPKRRQEAREEGNVARSMELPSSFVLLTGMVVLHYFGAHIVGNLSEIWKIAFRNLHTMQVGEAQFQEFLNFLIYRVAIILSPLLLAIFVVAVGSNLAQFGFLFSTKIITPKLDKMSPIKGLKKIFSKDSISKLAKSLLKMFIIGYVGYVTVAGEIDRIPTLAALDLSQIATYIGNVSFTIGVRIAVLLIILAVVDYGWERWQYEESLKMSKHDVKEESKQAEGDPAVKSRVRSLQREVSRRRMMSAVPTADVIVTNPTHFAVALKYDRGKMAAPQVVAKGRNRIALKIKEIAKEHGLPIVEDKQLARALFEDVDLDQFVPVNLYKAVAEILAYVYRLKNRTLV